MLTRMKSSLGQIHRYSWISLAVCWLIWVLNAYDREIVLRLGPSISDTFDLSPDTWGVIASLIMLSLAVMPIAGSAMSDRYGGGHKRAAFQVPLVIGTTALAFLSGFKAVSHNIVSFIAVRVGVNLGAGWGEPVGVSNTAEWWPRERRGFALGAHHTGYPIGSLLSGIGGAAVLTWFGDDGWSYAFFFSLVFAIPIMLFWRKYSTADKIDTLYADIETKGLTAPEVITEQAERPKGVLRKVLATPQITGTAVTTMLTQIVYMGVNTVLPLYLHNIVGLSLAESAGLSVVFTLTGIIGQVLWPTLSDLIGRRITIVICGVWMAISVGCLYFATTSILVVIVQLAFGLVANAVWPIYYATASVAAPDGGTSTANGVITTAMFIGGGIAPVLMGRLVGLGGGWEESTGYVYTFLCMAAFALIGALISLAIRGARDSAETSTNQVKVSV
jgi:MFS family permease